ncbi:hypothetical protein [Pseudoalteromonas byunsanensis]|uniref:Uncharacterized protein n=1 Tax=Pseudoalteromonas byunsanensis TaxID=327939 RepID=A0A1S1N8L3_9GAMM|nr:hypothetical protein [Pseudoalteromonas byunsanensis]OHU95848.1 hypothetical protein BIW53_08480 [Pseudoalteromonas byunsanensis]
MRFLLIFITLAFSFGCSLTPEMAPKLNVPPKPILSKEIYQLSYSTELDSARIKSVQLPAHPIEKTNSVRIVADKVAMTDTLKSHIERALKKHGLKIVTTKKADYILNIHQLDLTFGPNKTYILNVPKTSHALYQLVTQKAPSYQCSNIIASVSMRLTHIASSDVVWFAKSSIDSASFQGIPLQFSYTKEQKITNEHEVLSFIVSQNTEQARIARADAPVEVPKYVVDDVISEPQKVAGACSETEVSALSSAMHQQLAAVLIDKINVL